MLGCLNPSLESRLSNQGECKRMCISYMQMGYLLNSDVLHGEKCVAVGLGLAVGCNLLGYMCLETVIT